MLDRFIAMPMKLALGVHHVFASVPQLLNRIVYAGVGRHWGSG
jgi:hypothetical protein